MSSEPVDFAEAVADIPRIPPKIKNFIEVTSDNRIIIAGNYNAELPSKELPQKFLHWITEGRRAMYNKILNKDTDGRFHSAHLPVMTTYSKDTTFPFNSSNKGVGFLPKPEYLEYFIERFKKAQKDTEGIPWQDCLKQRIEAISEFYLDETKMDRRLMTSLEIFERTTFNNIQTTPVSSLHYAGNSPVFISFTLNCVVEMCGVEDRRHVFIRLARTMFEFDSFHISQTNFPYAYLFWISEVSDKTPYRVPEKEGEVQTQTKISGDIEWKSDAMAAVNRAPGMIRQFITEQIENYARDRGFRVIDDALVAEAREVLERKQHSATERADVKMEEFTKLTKKERYEEGGFSWSEEAIERMERVPEGFMRESSQRTVEENARKNGNTHITLKVCDKGLEYARAKMETFFKEQK